MYKYAVRNDQTQMLTGAYSDAWQALEAAANAGWDECETTLMESDTEGFGFMTIETEFPCTYSFHYGEEHYTCELTSNRPDAYCEVHSA